jgi:IclR family acetate operon transcriptional repressor
MSPSTPAGPRRIATVERTLEVLDVLCDAAEDLGTSEIARRTRINVSTVSRLLATLTAHGVVQRVEATGRFRLGPRLIDLGQAALANVDLRDLARPHLAVLVEATGETATLSLPGGGDATVTVDFVQSPASVQSVARIGRPSVPHATAVGKVLLAYGGRLPAGRLAAYTERTITDRARLEGVITRVRQRGWADAVGEREPGLNAVAAPVFGFGGVVVAVLGLQGPASRFDRRAMTAAGALLVEHAAKLSVTGAG